MAAILAGMAVLGAAASAAQRVARDLNGMEGGVGVVRDPVLEELSNRMDTHEDTEFHKLSASVGGLYIHWFFSVLALVECIVRLVLYGVAIFIWSLILYLSCCLSCGKTVNMPSEPLMVACVARYAIYSTFMCGLISNFICPFAPVLYFWKRRVSLIRPPGLQRQRPLCRDEHACCTCTEFGHGMFLSNGIDVPVWKMAEVYLSTVAVLHILGGGCSAWHSLCDFKWHLDADAYLSWASTDIVRDMAADTAIFYHKHYDVTTYEAFLQNRFGGGGGGGGGGYANPSQIAPQHQHQKQQYHQPPQQYHQPQQQQQQQQQQQALVYAESSVPGQQRSIPVVVAVPIH